MTFLPGNEDRRIPAGVNPAAALLPRSGIRAIMDAAVRTPDTVRLEIGDPSFDTPPHIQRAATAAAAAGATHYAPNTGISELREGLAGKALRVNELDVTSDQIIVTQGATQALFSALQTLLQPGDGILLPTPAWPNYEMMCSLCRLQTVHYSQRAETAYLPDPDEVDFLASRRGVRALVLNSPSNPLGTLIPKTEVERLCEVARRHDLWVLSDECYDQIVFTQRALSPALYAPERTIAIYSFSKTYAMTGWRVGYAALPKHIVGIFARCQETMLACVSTVAQHAALAALEGPQGAVEEMRSTYARRRDLLIESAHDDLVAATPAGAFFGWLYSPEADSAAQAIHLLNEHGVATAPGVAFGSAGEGHLRLSLAASDEALERGISRINECRQNCVVPNR